MIHSQSDPLLSKFAQPVSIAHCIKAITLRAAQTRTVGLDAAFTEVPLGEDRKKVLNVCQGMHSCDKTLIGRGSL